MMDEVIDEVMIDKADTTTISSLHIESGECSCPECQNGRKHLVQILYIDRYVTALNFGINKYGR